MGGGVSIESKAVYALGSEAVQCSVAGMQGLREDMEDQHIALPRAAVTKDGSRSVGLFAVLDGHAGKECAQLAAAALPSYLLHQDDDDDNNDGTSDAAPTQFDADWLEDEVMTCAVLECDEELRGREYMSRESIGGTTLVFAFVVPITSDDDDDGKKSTTQQSYAITVGNVGDSRAVFGRRNVADSSHGAHCDADNIYAGCSFDAVPLSVDHKPDDKLEEARIVAAGGHVGAGRVDGNLAVARALGDFTYKGALSLDARAQKVVCVPEYQRTTAVRGDFLFLACDGVYDVMSSAAVVAMVGRLLGGDDEAASRPDAVVRAVLDHCLAEGSTDNMTALLVLFEDGTSYHRAGWRFYPGKWTTEQNGTGGGSESFMVAYTDNVKAYGLDVDAVMTRVKAGDYSPIEVNN